MRSFILLSLFWILCNPSIGQDESAFLTRAITRVAVNSPYSYHFEVSPSADADFTVDLPDWLIWDPENQTIEGISQKIGQYPVSIQATTSDATISQQFMLTVYDERTINILPLGDSITNGSSGHYSYRKALWEILSRHRYNFDFIGSWNGYRDFDDVPDPGFDTDHEGHAGWKTSDILQPPEWDSIRGNLTIWIDTYTPDIVLILLGTNDVFQCVNSDDATGNLETIIEILRGKNPKVEIFLAQIPPMGKRWADERLCEDVSYGEAIITFNKHLHSFIPTVNTPASPVIEVDLYAILNPETDLFDSIHPNEIGEKKLARSWYRAIKPYLNCRTDEEVKISHPGDDTLTEADNRITGG